MHEIEQTHQTAIAPLPSSYVFSQFIASFCGAKAYSMRKSMFPLAETADWELNSIFRH